MALDRLVMTQSLGSLAVSQYLNFDFNSIAVTAEGIALAFNEDGIFRLDSGNLDGRFAGGDEVQSRVRFARSRLGNTRRKRIRAIVATGEFTGNMIFTVTGDEVRASVDARAQPALTLGVQTVISERVPRNVYGVNFDLEVENCNGADFSIDSIDLYPVILPHRR
jgi:hypothetical protein